MPLLPADASAGQGLAALDGQTAKLDQANGRSADLVAIADACAEDQRIVADKLKPKSFLDRFRRSPLRAATKP